MTDAEQYTTTTTLGVGLAGVAKEDVSELFGDDDVWTSNTNSVYRTQGSNFTNGKKMRFNLDVALNDIRLSKRARLIMGGCFLPNITNMNTSILRVCPIGL